MSRKKQVLFLFCFMIFLLVVMNTISPGKTLDSRIRYSYTEALEYIWHLSPEDSRAYAWTETLDFLLIATYSTLLLYFIRWVLPVAGMFAFVAFIPGIFDFIETLSIFLALVTGSSDFIFAELGMITTMKWMSGFGIVLLGLGTLSQRGSRRV